LVFFSANLKTVARGGAKFKTEIVSIFFLGFGPAIPTPDQVFLRMWLHEHVFRVAMVTTCAVLLVQGTVNFKAMDVTYRTLFGGPRR